VTFKEGGNGMSPSLGQKRLLACDVVAKIRQRLSLLAHGGNHSKYQMINYTVSILLDKSRRPLFSSPVALKNSLLHVKKSTSGRALPKMM